MEGLPSPHLSNAVYYSSAKDIKDLISFLDPDPKLEGPLILGLQKLLAHGQQAQVKANDVGNFMRYREYKNVYKTSKYTLSYVSIHSTKYAAITCERQYHNKFFVLRMNVPPC
jgi:hypothetical protein